MKISRIGAIVFFGIGSIKSYDWYSIKTLPPTLTPTNDYYTTITPTPTPTPTPIPTTTSDNYCPTMTPTQTTITSTPIPTSTDSTCLIPLPTTTLTCQSRHDACEKCKEDQICVQVGKLNDGVYTCPKFECQDCPKPVCDPPCKCKEECVISRPSMLNHSCPVAQCKAIPVCLTCPPVSCDSIRCEENFECKVNAGSCDVCPSVSCEPKPCVECATEPLTCFCPRGKECKRSEGSCYKCPSVSCVDLPDPCENCKGECAVTPHPNCENCPPQRLCVDECRECSPFLPNWKCQNPKSALYVSRTCTNCSQYLCKEGIEHELTTLFIFNLDCKNCEGHVPKCECEHEEDCVLQPRTCDQCPTYYCKKGIGIFKDAVLICLF